MAYSQLISGSKWAGAILFSSIWAQPALAIPPVEALPEGSRVSTQIESLANNQSIQSFGDTQQLFPPASTLKVVTALAAKLELGDSFRFETRVIQNQQDWVIQFSGDPLLTNKDLSDMLSQIKAKGIKQVDGDIWLDNSIFSGYERAVGWPWDILGVCYSAPASAITLDKNCVQASIYTNNDGSTRVFVPEHQPIYVETQAKTVTKVEKESSQCSLELTTADDNHFKISGCLVSRDKPLPLRFAVQDTSLYVSRVMQRLLNQQGIAFNGQVKVGAKPNTNSSKLLASHKSPSLDLMLEKMLKSSNNLIADNLTKTLGHHFYLQPGSFANGTEAIKQIIFANTGIDLSRAQLADGSGLSRNNRLTNHSLSQVLRYVWENEQQLGLIDIMPTAGESGTLQYRRSMRKSPVKGNIVAKSGSVYGTYNMAGFGLDEKGEPQTLFVQFIADYYPNKKRDSQPTVAPITQFETLFYQQIVEFSQAIPKK
ncbi:serine-type D-Ala-D-Ala carboxypeptidase [Vibrio astriarenae]|uniref:serine-type D-Ala-D-Ala carboxypeptidase n=1 Tax=Vibrio astriarenae TaxID=1481923 RepID=UPI0037369315